MRLAAQVRGGFYPAPEGAIALASSHLQPPDGQPFAMLDPCAGEGAAIRQLGDSLRCRPDHRYAIELDDHRADVVRAALPDGHVLAPADCFGCRANGNSFSFIWLNPPFDDAYGGRRIEDQFLRIATDWLMPSGVMAFVCPEDVVNQYADAYRHFATYYQDTSMIPFPNGQRQFNEVIVLGHKRRRPKADRDNSSRISWDAVTMPPGFRYQIPSGAGPKVFRKVEPTESELQQMLAASPLRRHLRSPASASLPSPPLPLGIGHIALLLASGHLDGIVQADGHPAHVVRGTSRKHSFVADVTDTENADGSTTTKTTISERIELVIRTVDARGKIETLTDPETADQ